ncbi:MAG: M50 family metallopeptidase, partial [Alphaproteobacteria bacterium]
ELMAAGRTLEIAVARGGERIALEATPEARELVDRFGNRYAKGELGLRAQVAPKLGVVDAAAPAGAAGLAPGDLVVAAAGEPVADFGRFAEIVRARPGQSTPIEVIRDGARLTLTVTPEPVPETDADGAERQIGRIGVTAAEPPPVRLGPGAAAAAGVVFVWEKSGLILDYLWQIFAGVRPVAEIGGVLRIAQIAGDTAAISFVALVGFGMMLSLNLGLINLFPVPMLDGGHIVFLAIEWARGRRMSERSEEIGYRLGFAMVVGVMLFATWNDLTHFQVFERLRTWIG